MFRQDYTCLVLLFVAHGIVVSSTGLSPSLARLSRLFHYHSPDYHDWAVPLSLATTKGISVDFFSSGYLDVSVPLVRLLTLWIQVKIPSLC